MEKYMIWEGFMDKLEKKMRTVERKCRKYGVEFSYHLTGEEEYREFKDKAGEKYTLRFVEVEAEGKAQINGWEWLASVEHTDKGNIIKSPSDVTIPNEYYTCQPFCEHCRSDRYRKYVYLVRNQDSGEVKMVGRSCLKDYTHGLSAEAVAWYQSLFNGFEELEDEEPSGGFGWWKQAEYYEIEEVTRYMSEVIRHFGYVPRNENGNQTTSSKAQDYYDVAHDRHSRFSLREGYFDRIKREMKDIGFDAESQHAKEEARAALAWIAEQDETKSSYIHNLKVVVAMGKVQSNHFGIIASLLPAWNKDLERQAEQRKQKEADAVSQYVGEVGQRIPVKVASGKIITSWETDYGWTHLIKFVSEEGNVFMWAASHVWDLPDDLNDISEIKGTIKKHEEFRGVKQTFLTRCKVIKVREKEEKPHEPYNPEAESAVNELLESLN